MPSAPPCKAPTALYLGSLVVARAKLSASGIAQQDLSPGVLLLIVSRLGSLSFSLTNISPTSSAAFRERAQH